ncbi:metal-dependent hydrolase [Scopulibacillus cellulosilyticus]|uniref:Metal-dependent hydrolase n=1 Tax=Scopulibacillus cellulosilyticus TaxID=2665665 RepID=A0ABW2PTH0_9BACL
MTGKTHLIGGIALGEALQYFMGTHAGDPIFLAACAGGALLPDICHSGSKIGRKLPVLSRLINGVFGHRTFTHSIFFLIVVSAFFTFFLPHMNWLRDGVLIGMLSHMILDAATTNGIALFWPIKWKVRFPLYTHTGGTIEHVIMVILTLAVLWLGANEFLI